MQQILDEIAEKVPGLTSQERQELIQLLQEEERKEKILEKQKIRYKVLYALWQAVDGNYNSTVNFYEVTDNLGLSKETADDVYQYFHQKQFFSNQTFGGQISLSHPALTEIENSLANPNQSTQHFATTVIQNFNAPVASVQSGNRNVANINQNIRQNFSEILEQLAILKREFQSQNFEEKDDAIEIIYELENEIVKEKPNKSKIKYFLVSTKDFAVKTGTELAASTLAKLLESQMGIKG